MIRILDRFCLGKPFKACSYSIIYEAADLRIQKSCLCKVYEYGRLSPHEAAVLHREVALIKRLRHPLLVHYLSVLHDRAGQRYFLFMEQVKQETLSQYIRRRKALIGARTFQNGASGIYYLSSLIFYLIYTMLGPIMTRLYFMH